jgi:hypothetical protein
MPIYSGIDVPNLYPDTRKRDGHWRYRRPDGTFKSFAATEAKAVTLALEANASAEKAPQKIHPASSIEIWATKFIQYRETLDPALTGKQSWKNRKAAIHEFARVFSGTPTHAINLQFKQSKQRGIGGNEYCSNHCFDCASSAASLFADDRLVPIQ